MKKLLLGLALLSSMLISTSVVADTPTANGHAITTEQVVGHSTIDEGAHSSSAVDGENGHQAAHGSHGDDHSAHAGPAVWSIIPFVLLLLMIATGPLFYAHFWHKNYPIVAIILGALTVGYYLFGIHDTHHPLHALQEYVSFIALIAALFVASGGIVIKVDKAGKPLVNIGLLIFGAIIANVIGTTGASMLLIRPFIRLNKDRIKPYHVVFFIFMVSNVGGCLTPIGDPPLFLGFLKGVAFEWTMLNLIPEWAFGISLLAIIFYFIDKRNMKHYVGGEEETTYTGKISFKGGLNVLFLAITIVSVFIDPAKISALPTLVLTEGGVVFTALKDISLGSHDIVFSFWREIIMLTVAVLAFKMAKQENLKANEFDFEPIKEVAFIFVGIFATMMPALQLIGEFAKGDGQSLISVDSLYWATGFLSGVLDNAPTYLNFLSAGLGAVGLDIGSPQDVQAFMNGVEGDGVSFNTTNALKAISVAAVFFGAFTYIGNAPNFMVKSIAEQVGVKMPSFMSYIAKYSIPILLPVLFLTWLIFFAIPQWIA